MSIGGRYAKIVEIKNETDKHLLGYLSVYLLTCLGFSLNSFSNVFTLIAITFIIGYIYVSNDLIYINPILNMLYKDKIYSAKIRYIGSESYIEKIVISNCNNILSIKEIEVIDIDSTYVFHKN